MNEFWNWTIDRMIENIKEYEGKTVWGYQIRKLFFDKVSMKGSYFDTTQETKDFIIDHWDEIGNATIFYFGRTGAKNPFHNTDKFFVSLLEFIANKICDRCKFFTRKIVDSEFTLTKNRIDELTAALEAMKK